MMAMAYIRTTACADLTLKEFQAQWTTMTTEEQEKLREWARAEGKGLGIEVD
jgi:hypothetical protein